MRAPPASCGVVLVTSGPGATNAVTGIADALMDSIPMVVITGQVPTALIGSDAFQECDTVGDHPLGHQAQCAGARTWPKTCREPSTKPSTSPPPGRPGPVLIDIPKDVQFASRRLSSRQATCAFPTPMQPRGGLATQRASREAVAMIAKAQRPLLYTGGGVINAGPAGHRRPCAPLPSATGIAGDLDPDGPRRLSGQTIRNGSAWWGCTAPMRPTTPCTIAT